MHTSRFALAALALVLGGSALSARPLPVGVASSPVAVDVSRLRALGLGPSADLVQQAVARELGGGIGGGRVVVRLTGLSLNAYAGEGSGGGGGSGGLSGGGNDFDYLEGDILMIGPRGEVVSERHQVASSPASSGGAYYLPGSEQRRVAAVARNFADWVRRYGR